MNIEINRIALYLSGKLPPYYKPYHKFAFIENLEANSDGTFTEAVFDRITKYIPTDEGFYAECLLRLQKYDNALFLSFLDVLEVPLDARGKIIPGIQGKSQVKVEFEKTIGFITPFDDKQEKLQNLIQGILDVEFDGWKIETVSLEKDGDGKYLWESIDDFLEKYPIYIVDFRDGNLNVAIELGGLLKSKKPCITITEEKPPTDIIGFIRIPKPRVNMEDTDTKTAQDKFKKLLIPQLTRYI